MRSKAHRLPWAAGQAQEPLSGSCAKRAGRPPTVSQVGNTGLGVWHQLVLQRSKTWRLYPGCSLRCFSSLSIRLVFTAIFGFFTCKMEAPLGRAGTCPRHRPQSLGSCLVLNPALCPHLRRDLGSLPPLRCSNVKAAFPSRIFRPLSSLPSEFTHHSQRLTGWAVHLAHGQLNLPSHSTVLILTSSLEAGLSGS